MNDRSLACQPVHSQPVHSQPPPTTQPPAPPSTEDQSVSAVAARLVQWFRGRDRVLVAFSGGVDSSVVLAASLRGCPDETIAVTARSPSVAEWQLQLAIRIAQQLNARHQIIETNEVDLPAYAANDGQRCFHCKSTLYAAVARHCLSQHSLSQRNDTATVVSGTNLDDLGDYRPGIEAGSRAGVATPLADLGIGKAMVREIANLWQLENAELPASPCLASRIAYGVTVTPERLRRIEQAEDHLRCMGLSEMRVRLHDGELARIEVPVEQMGTLIDPATRQALTEQLRAFGFRYVTLDLQGFSSGSMNRQLVTLDQLASEHSSPRSVPPPAVDPARSTRVEASRHETI